MSETTPARLEADTKKLSGLLQETLKIFREDRKDADENYEMFKEQYKQILTVMEMSPAGRQ